MQESSKPLKEANTSLHKSIKHSEKMVIKHYLDKVKVQKSDTNKSNKSEGNKSKKRVKITIESILHKEHNISELFNILKKERNSSKEMEINKSLSDENYTIEGTLEPQKEKKSLKPKVEKRKGTPTAAQKKLWRRAKKEPLMVALKRVGAKVGDRVFIRIFKKSRELEVWIRPKNSRVYKLLKIYSVCKYSGGLGPKQKTGDKKSPEGFYNVGYSALNPNSSFHLSFNLGFPNSYDKYYGYTGSYLMVHGKCASVGCYAMGDRNIDDIYMLVERALLDGQLSVPVHIFPFRMTKVNLAKHKKSRWYKFWRNLKEGYDAFEKTHVVPKITAVDGVYKVVVRR